MTDTLNHKSIIQTITTPFKQSLAYLESKIISNFPLLNKIKASQPLLTTLQYDAIYPYLAHHLYHSINYFDHSVHHYNDEDSRGRLLNGFFLVNNQTAEGHYFIFTYEGIWLYNNKPLQNEIIQEYANQLICNSHECLIYNKPITKENFTMNNIERLQMEIAGIELPHEELLVYLEESGLKGYEDYQSNSSASKRAIYEASLSVLNSLANQPHLMKNYKQDDMTVSEFAKHLQNRIKQLDLKVRQMPNSDSTPNNFFNLFQ